MRRLGIAVVAGIVMVTLALPAWGAVDKNPNAIELTDIQCEGGPHSNRSGP